MLQTYLKSLFTSAIRKRGERYYSKNKVLVLGEYENTIDFEVSGTENYICHIQSVGKNKSIANIARSIEMSCNCPYFKSYGNCKHLWACIKVGDDKRLWDKNLPSQVKPVLKAEPKVRVKSERQKPWQKKIENLKDYNAELSNHRLKKPFDVYYSLSASYDTEKLIIQFYKLNPKTNHLESKRLREKNIETLSNPIDRELMPALTPHLAVSSWETSTYYDYGLILPSYQDYLLNKLCETGRFFPERGELSYDINKINFFKFHENVAEVLSSLEVEGKNIRLKTYLDSQSERVSLDSINMLTYPGYYFTNNSIGKFDAKYINWLDTLRPLGKERIPLEDKDLLIPALFNQEFCPKITLSNKLGWDFGDDKPTPKMTIKDEGNGNKVDLFGAVSFNYGHCYVSALSVQEYAVDPDNKIIFERDFESETTFLVDAEDIGFTPPPSKMSDLYSFRVRKDSFVSQIKLLMDHGWKVEAHGKKIETASDMDFSITSGIDWFDLEGEITFESGQSLTLPELMKSLKKGETLISLGNNEYGMLPEEWLKKYSSLTEMGDSKNSKGLRFSKAQGIFLDKWFSGEKNFKKDKGFIEFQKKIKKAHLKKKVKPSAAFKGSLRSYQEEGLSWLEYLKELAFGGILADDMGLGKTIQIIALLQKEQRNKGGEKKTNLIVVPRSLVFNWSDELEKFAPNLSVLSYVDKQRADLSSSEISKYDVVITTYHTLRIDFDKIQDLNLKYIILDEAQYIKNPKSQISRACKALESDFKLALTGTPIENSISDLFSILDFVNPGLVSQKLKDKFSSVSSDSEDLKKLSGALSSMILRRTKGQVLKDLPDKVENTIKCELSKDEQVQYNNLKKYYQARLSKQIEENGLAKSRFEVLDALIRLRQAACHPALINKNRMNSKSAKLEVLFEQMRSLTSAGNKCLVFSQFTSFLNIIRPKLEKENIEYLYLDGKTRKRKELVEEFESRDDLKVFLISLKAGGVGLNLTSANYVFILDPWWNPASEAQAIDRVHRIGQKNNVFSYKLIAKNTVEEKILELQKGKKELSDNIINNNSGMLKSMNMNDINYLLS